MPSIIDTIESNPPRKDKDLHKYWYIAMPEYTNICGTKLITEKMQEKALLMGKNGKIQDCHNQTISIRIKPRWTGIRKRGSYFGWKSSNLGHCYVVH